MTKYYLAPIVGWLMCFSIMLNSQPLSKLYSSNDYNFSKSQLLIKVRKGFDFEINDDIVKTLDIQKMLFEMHKLVRSSDIISVKKPTLQYMSSNNNIYILEFDAVNNVSVLIQDLQDLYFIDYARKVPIP
ncbi:MAG: hypothetical protein ACPG49_07900 [Chitinophagales bacterium]